jgi:hypothetical protein
MRIGERMKIIFQEEGTGESFIFDCGWNTGKEILDLLWKKMTIDVFNRKVEEDNKKIFEPIKKKGEMNGSIKEG